jgi:hypothetical protein
MQFDEFGRFIKLDLDYHSKIPYFAQPNTPIHRWFFTTESTSLAHVAEIFKRVDASSFAKIIDPYCGSGTVGLQSMLKGIPFQGIDKAAHCVIASRAKIFSHEIREARVKVIFSKVLQVLGTQKFSNQITSQSLASLLNGIQKNIGYQGQIAEKYAVLSCLYMAILVGENSLDRTLAGTLNRFETNVLNLLADIKMVHFPSNGVFGSVIWGDCTRMNWSGLFPSHEKSENAKSLMITSIPYIASLRRDSPLLSIIENASKSVLLNLEGPFRLNKTSLNIDGILRIFKAKEMAPSAATYFARVAICLTRFKRFATPGSIAVIDTENAVVDGVLIEADKAICAISEIIGYKIQLIHTTHFIIKPGTISNSPNSIRGGTVYLSL